MNLISILSYVFSALIMCSGLGILFSKNVFKSALLLLVILVAIAGLYVLNFAEFVAVTQLMVYAGGILVIIIFGIMLTTKISGKPLVVQHANMLSGVVAGVTLLFILIKFALPVSVVDKHIQNNPEDIGIALMTNYALPFEIAGILLLITLIGAAVTVSFLKSNRKQDGA